MGGKVENLKLADKRGVSDVILKVKIGHFVGLSTWKGWMDAFNALSSRRDVYLELAYAWSSFP